MNYDFIIIDDDKTATFITSMLFKKNFPEKTFLCFNEADKALEFLVENLSNLKDTIVLLDLNMPVLDGFQLLDAIKDKEHSLKVIILSSSIYPEDKTKALNFPFVHSFLIKPINSMVLKELIDTV